MNSEERDAVTVDSGVSDCDCKVGSATSRYGLDDVDEELARRWTENDGEAHSLRDLEELFNLEVLDAALREAGGSPVDGEVENFYRILDDDASEGSRIEVEKRLQREGVDVEEVTSYFVSHQTIHNHLRECLGVSYDSEPDPETRLRNGRNAVFGLQNRTRTVTRNTLENLANAGVIELGNVDVFVDIMVSCEDCGRMLSVDDVLEDGGCGCRTGS